MVQVLSIVSLILLAGCGERQEGVPCSGSNQCAVPLICDDDYVCAQDTAAYYSTYDPGWQSGGAVAAGGGGGGGGCGGKIVCDDGSCSPSCSTCSQGCCSSHGGC